MTSDQAAPDAPSRRRRRGFTLTEMLVVIGVIALLLALLLPALGGVRTSGQMTESMSNMRQIGEAVGTYGSEFRDSVLPSQFNHEGNAFVGHPRCLPGLGVWHARGTWADILWTQYEMGVFPEAGIRLGNDYRNDSPDQALYELVGRMPNPLRSAAENSHDVPGGTAALPYGTGATERALPGYFAANNFFNDDRLSPTYNGPFSTAQIRMPAKSLYLIDSFAGEVIEDENEPFDTGADPGEAQVDFRYADACLLLLLDGHVAAETRWTVPASVDPLEALWTGPGVRVTDLTAR